MQYSLLERFDVCYFIGIYKSTNFSIIISTLKIVQTNLFIVVVTTVSEGVDSRNITGSIRNNCTYTPSIVCVACNNLALGIGNCNNIPLKILHEVVSKAVVYDTAYALFIIIKRSEGVAIPGFLENLCTVKSIFVLYTVYSLACSDSVSIVGIRVFIKGLKLTSLFPSKIVAEVLCGVALCIIGLFTIMPSSSHYGSLSGMKVSL